MIKVLGISASPRKEGSRSEKLLADLLGYVPKFAGSVEMLRLRNLKIASCEGCYSESPEKCVFPCIHKDDTNSVLQKIIEADALAIATPIHWGGPSALLSQLLGKMTAVENNNEEIWERIKREPFLGKPFVLLCSQDGDGAAMALSQVNWALNHMGMFCLPRGMIFEPSILQRPIARFGLRVIGERKFEWIPNTIRLAARNLVACAEFSARTQFDDHKVKEPRC